MPSHTLPARPSLQHLKNEAKQLHQAIAAGDAEAAARARANLRRLGDGDPVDDVTLQEAQHVLGREYGFGDWQGLVAAAELKFDDLAALSDDDTHRLLREVDQKDLIVALKLASDDVKKRMLTGMTERVRLFIAEEAMFLGPLPEEEIRQVHTRIAEQVRLLALDGSISWPPGTDTPPPKRSQGPPLAPALAAALRRRLQTLGLDEIRALVRLLSAWQQDHGIVSFDTVAEATVDGFVGEGLRLAADGTSPELLEDLLLTRARALLQSFDNRLRMTIEACASIRSGDNPRVVEHKLLVIYRSDFDYSRGIDVPERTPDELRQHLRQQPISTADLDRFAAVLFSLADIARRQGRMALVGLVDDVAEDGFLQAGVLQVAKDVPCQDLIEDLESRMPAVIDALGLRLHLFAAGITAIAGGGTGAALDAAMADDRARQRTRKWFP